MDANFNFDEPESTPLPSLGSTGLGSLGNLAQQARVKELKTAKGILIVVGIAMMVWQGIDLARAKNIVDEAFDVEIKKLNAKGLQVDQALVDEGKETAMRSVRVITIGMIGVGILMCVLGFCVYKYPLFSTATGLIIYIGVQAMTAFFAPASILNALIWKILIIVGLAKAVQAALAYERDMAKSQVAEVPA